MIVNNIMWVSGIKNKHIVEQKTLGITGISNLIK